MQDYTNLQISAIGKNCTVENISFQIECSQFTKGAYWCYGCDWYVIDINACVPVLVAEKDDSEILEWIENNREQFR